MTAALLGSRCAAVGIAVGSGIDASLSPSLAGALAEVVAPVAGDGRADPLRRGDRRAVLDRIGVARLTPVSAHDGAVVSVTDAGERAQKYLSRPGQGISAPGR